MASKGGPQKEPKSEQPKPNQEAKDGPNPGDPPKKQDDKGGE
jgi:hypothetical protein